MAKHWFVEESMPDGSYRVIQRGMDEGEALDLLQSHPTTNRLAIGCAEPLVKESYELRAII